MSMKRKDFIPKKELKSRKWFNTGRNTMKRLSFENKGICVFYYIPVFIFSFFCLKPNFENLKCNSKQRNSRLLGRY